MYTLTKDFRFEAAHRLGKGYEGKCKNIHGHSWNGKISIKKGALDKFDMAIDFTDMKRITKSIEDFFDHTLMVYKEDEELISLCKKQKWAIIVMDANPTCEALAKMIHDNICKEHHVHSPDLSVTINETCTTSCTYEN